MCILTQNLGSPFPRYRELKNQEYQNNHSLGHAWTPQNHAEPVEILKFNFGFPSEEWILTPLLGFGNPQYMCIYIYMRVETKIRITFVIVNPNQNNQIDGVFLVCLSVGRICGHKLFGSTLTWQPGWFAEFLFTPPKFNSSPLKNDGWKTSLSFWDGTFSGASC